MDIMAILAIVSKGLTIAQALFEAGQTAAPIIIKLQNIIKGAEDGTVTDEELFELETLLDAQLAEFNKPLEG